MAKPKNDMEWVWVIVERYQSEEKLYGQVDEERQESFIPVFSNKEDALMALGQFKRRKDHYYQVQATRYGEVTTPARESGFKLFFLDGEGQILDKESFTQ